MSTFASESEQLLRRESRLWKRSLASHLGATPDTLLENLNLYH